MSTTVHPKDRTVLRTCEILVGFGVVVAMLAFTKEEIREGGSRLHFPVNPSSPIIGTIQLLSLESPITAGTKISDATFKSVFWPRNKVPIGAVSSAEPIRNLYAKSDIPSGVPLQLQMFTSDPLEVDAPGRAMRDVTIQVYSYTSMGVRNVPGRFDVLLETDDGGVRTIKRIATEARLVSATESEQSVGAFSVVVNVTPEEGLDLEAASAMGKLFIGMPAK